MTTPIIEVKNIEREFQTKVGFLQKNTKTVKALRGLSFSVEAGEIFGLLGPNGAGKTTTIKILTTMLTPTAGEIKILGLDPVTQYKQLRPQINFILGGERNLYWRLTAYDNLAYFSDLYRVPRKIQEKRIEDLLDLVGLTEVANQKVETFSKGMKQKLQIARGLVNNPKILFLDEPTIGLDPVSARQLRNILGMLKAQGTTIVITTHYMYEADELCDRIAFVTDGRLVMLDTPENLKKLTNQHSIVECRIEGFADERVERLSKLAEVSRVQIEQWDHELLVRLHTNDPQALIPALFSYLHDRMILNLTISSPSLEDAYVHIVGGQK